MELNYTNLFEKYRFQFEGLPDLVFYYDLYPTSYKKKNFRHYFTYGLKYDPERKIYNKKYWENYRQKYEEILTKFLEELVNSNPKVRFGIITIPSSKKNHKNRVTIIVQNLLKKNSKISKSILDLTNTFIRKDDKESACKEGTRNKIENEKTLCFKKENSLSKIDALIVVDDVVTTGNSFSAVRDLINQTGFSGNVVNFAYMRSMNISAHNNYDRWNNCKDKRKWNPGSLKKNSSIKGIIFDFDQTLIDTASRNEEFEVELKNINITRRQNLSFGETFYQDFLKKNEKIYTVYDSKQLQDFQKKRMPFAILSNSPEKRLNLLSQISSIQEFLYPDIWDSHNESNADKCKEYEKFYKNRKNSYNNGKTWRYTFYSPDNMIPIPSEKLNDKSIYFSKPSTKGVHSAIQYLRDNFGICEESRIVGIGNTPEDIIAYHDAGIESVLALWGIPLIARNYARQNWGADYCFDSMKDFFAWIDKINNNMNNNETFREELYKLLYSIIISRRPYDNRPYDNIYVIIKPSNQIEKYKKAKDILKELIWEHFLTGVIDATDEFKYMMDLEYYGLPLTSNYTNIDIVVIINIDNNQDEDRYDQYARAKGSFQFVKEIFLEI